MKLRFCVECKWPMIVKSNRRGGRPPKMHDRCKKPRRARLKRKWREDHLEEVKKKEKERYWDRKAKKQGYKQLEMELNHV